MSQSLVQSQEEKHSRVLSSRQNLINSSYDLVLSSFRTITSAYLDKPICQRVEVGEIDENANAITGHVEWNLLVANILNNRKMTIGMNHRIVGNRLVADNYFTTSTGSKHVFSDKGLNRILGNKDTAITTPFRDRQVTWSAQKDQ